jgi:hypothetical protein
MLQCKHSTGSPGFTRYFLLCIRKVPEFQFLGF